MSVGLQEGPMGFGKHLLNGVISLVVSVVATVATAEDDVDTYTRGELLLAVAVSGFLSGAFTSYFASK